MALHKLGKSKSFQVDYCGCTAAALLLHEQSIRDAIEFVRRVKSIHDFVKTSISIGKDGVKIIYDNEQRFTTLVPSNMIAGSAIGKSPLHDTIGVVYISPLTGRHYPAFVHVYRCDSPRAAQKLLTRFRSYILIEAHRQQIAQLEQRLLDQNLLNLNHFDIPKPRPQSPKDVNHRINTGMSTSSTSSNSRQDIIDPVKSITEEFQKKIDSQQPLLFPPKDYDTIHAAHGHIQRAQEWKSTEPTIIGYTPIDPDDNLAPRQTRSNVLSTKTSTTNGFHKPELNGGNNARPRLATQRSDTTAELVETVSLAFDFLKDETSSILSDNEGDIEHLEVERQNKPAVFRFRPPPITGITKKLFSHDNNYELTKNGQPSNIPSGDESDIYPNYNNQQHVSQLSNGHRAHSETGLYYDRQQQQGMLLSPRFENRLVNGSGAPLSPNPLWTSTSPPLAGSQPNLLSHHRPSRPVPPPHPDFSPPIETRTIAAPLQHPLYASYPHNKPSIMTQQQEHQQRRLAPVPPPAVKKQPSQPQYLDTNEFILRASSGQLLRNPQYPGRAAPSTSKDNRPRSMHVNGAGGTMLDVYY